MKTFEEQRREFVELALKLVEIDLKKSNYKSIRIFNDMVLLYGRASTFIIHKYQLNDNETEIQKLRDLVGELG